MYNVVSALNHLHGLNGASPKHSVCLGPPTKVQEEALQRLGDEVAVFLEINRHDIKREEWQHVLTQKAVSYDGDEVYPAERLDWSRLQEALPPPEACGAVNATDVSEGAVRAALLNPELVMRDESELEDLPPTPKVWASDKEWETIAPALVRLGLCVAIELRDIGARLGKKVLGGMFGVKKAGFVRGKGPQRLVMSICPSNWIQHIIEGDMPMLPYAGQWHAVVLRSGEVLLISSEDLRCCFYVFRLPKPWHRWMALSKPIRRSLVGLEGDEPIYLASCVVPMGWISATGVIQHIHRLMLRQPIPRMSELPASDELRRDQPLPAHRREVGSSSTGRSADQGARPSRVEVNKVRPSELDVVYIGRTGQRFGFSPSKWANPFKVTVQRPVKQAVELFKQYMLSRHDLLSCLDELSGKRLACHCRRCDPCHGDVLIALWLARHEVGGHASRG